MRLHFLDNDSAFGQLMTRCWIMIAANVLFVLLTLPVVTIGAGWTALYHTLMRTLRGDGQLSPLREFWKGLKNNFQQATVCWIGILALLGFLALEWYWCGQFGGVFLTLRLGLVMIAAAVTVIAIYLFPTMAAFHGTIPDLLKDSIYFAFKKPLYLVVILFFNIFPFVLTYSDLQNLPLYAFLWCFIGFSAIGMITSTLLLREFTPYLPLVDACGDIIDDPEDADLLVKEKTEQEVLDEMRKLGM